MPRRILVPGGQAALMYAPGEREGDTADRSNAGAWVHPALERGYGAPTPARQEPAAVDPLAEAQRRVEREERERQVAALSAEERARWDALRARYEAEIATPEGRAGYAAAWWTDKLTLSGRTRHGGTEYEACESIFGAVVWLTAAEVRRPPSGEPIAATEAGARALEAIQRRRRTQAAARDRLYAERRAAGLCIECPEPVPLNPRTGRPYVRCAEHRALQAQAKREARAARPERPRRPRGRNRRRRQRRAGRRHYRKRKGEGRCASCGEPAKRWDHGPREGEPYARCETHLEEQRAAARGAR